MPQHDVLATEVGPDALRLPGRPESLRTAIDRITEVCDELGRIGEQLQGADTGPDDRGRTAVAMSRLMQRTGTTLEQDGTVLRQLVDAVQREHDLLREGRQDVLPELRARWEAARSQLVQAVQQINAEGTARADRAMDEHREQEREREQQERQERERRDEHGRGEGRGRGRWEDVPRESWAPVGAHLSAAPPRPYDPVNGQGLVKHLDDNLIAPHEAMFRNALGTHFTDFRGGEGLREDLREADGQLEAAVQDYRQTVRGLLEEFAGVVHRLQAADREVAEQLPFKELRAVHSAAPVKGPQSEAPQQRGVSGLDTIARLAGELQAGAQALGKLPAHLEDARLAMREGRMLPEGERVGSNQGFRRDWSAHLEALRHGLDAAREQAEAVADRLERLDEEGAQQVRQAARADA